MQMLFLPFQLLTFLHPVFQSSLYPRGIFFLPASTVFGCYIPVRVYYQMLALEGDLKNVYLKWLLWF